MSHPFFLFASHQGQPNPFDSTHPKRHLHPEELIISITNVRPIYVVLLLPVTTIHQPGAYFSFSTSLILGET
uniref:Uncharacterized protein n=1 Tax=Solanum lycopersicum TaxID=4081 RepID=A0A3Q7H6Z5_SOLLC